jgi:hypothetical protein
LPALGPAHARRLRALWRSAGWPCHDVIEAELLLAGALHRRTDAAGRETLHLTDAGLALIAGSAQRHRQARSRHEALVAQVAREMQRAGRLVWRALPLRAPPQPGADDPRAWPVVVPDVFSIRPSTLEDRLEPVVHEVKVSRADLLSDLRREAKREAYRALSSRCWYVLGEAVRGADDVPPQYGLMQQRGSTLEVLRPAPHRPMRLPLMTWMALARAGAEAPEDDAAQPGLANCGEETLDAGNAPDTPAR